MLYFIRTASFDKDFDRLAATDQLRVARALDLLNKNWQHPGLHVRKLKGYSALWEARASQSLRIVFQIQGKKNGVDVCILLRVGPHDILRTL